MVWIKALNVSCESLLGKADHEALAKHYEDTAKGLQQKVDDSKKTLQEYETHAVYYGRQAQDLQSHIKTESFITICLG